MDWRSEEGRALLWKAYPEGYLAKRGVRTIGDWQCTGIKDRWLYPDAGGAPSLQEGDPSYGVAFAAGSRGDLLPRPNPHDAATWACLLADLWESSGRPPCAGLALCAPDNYYENWYIVPGFVKNDPNYGYVDLPGLCYGDPKGWAHVEHLYPHFSGATLDPAEALIHARIMLRERL